MARVLSRINSDVLGEIFKWCTTGQDNDGMNWDLPALVLSQVCRHWNHVALSTPAIWSSVSCKGSQSFQLPDILAIYFQLCSRQLPLSVTIENWEVELPKLCEPILSIAPRIIALSTNAIQLVGSVCTSFPNLSVLKVLLQGNVDAYNTLLLVLCNMAVLDHLDIQAGCCLVGPAPAGRHLPIPLCALTALRFTMSSFYDIPALFLTIKVPLITSLFLSTPGCPPTFAFWSAVSDFLEASPTLFALELNDISFQIDDTLDNPNHLDRFLEALKNIRQLTLSHMNILPLLQRISEEQMQDRWLCFALVDLVIIFSRIPSDMFMEFVLSRAGLTPPQAQNCATLKSIHLDHFWRLTS
ncbi:hypothetical protein M422DRAFT_56569 [Sphaerobolus stellatus SS14]|uniref:F-box domain-containing protein n=1 Tax=Sphaerobolus stellatus (strain SS14) TaxID=990650 RepID=A0A0C9UF07_SPHS4|nr:hypothetical protein M422DRAFT_56569 [Sphaerobolus stellatus SS14]